MRNFLSSEVRPNQSEFPVSDLTAQGFMHRPQSLVTQCLKYVDDTLQIGVGRQVSFAVFQFSGFNEPFYVRGNR